MQTHTILTKYGGSGGGFATCGGSEGIDVTAGCEETERIKLA